ncbi:MAG: rRNA (guanosine-2-O-)-methyltransferase RlmB [Planctomycetota bacterium]
MKRSRPARRPPAAGAKPPRGVRQPQSPGPQRSLPRPAAPQKAAGPRQQANHARSRHQGRDEETYHGGRACEALFARRPQDIVRVYLTAEQQRRFAPLLAHCAAERRGFQIVEPENLARISGSHHHEGIAILARSCPRWSAADLERAADANRLAGPLVYLDGVQNPHNLGAILRTAAHFGSGALLGRRGELPPLSPAAVRVAEGAAECVPVCDLDDPAASLARLKRQGFRVVTTSSRAGAPAAAARLGRKVVLVLGSEGQGVSRPIAALADVAVQIPGTGAVESLNVSVACGILLAEACRVVTAGGASRSGT